MPYAILTMIWTSVIAVFLTVGTGLRLIPVKDPLQFHVVMALTATVLALFAHTMTMFYFIGTGKKIKDFVEHWDAKTKEDLRLKIVAMKRKIFPPMTFVCLVLMAAFILGGAAHAKRVPMSVHSWLAYGALIYHVHVSARETWYLFRNLDLIHEVNQLARERAEAAQAV